MKKRDAAAMNEQMPDLHEIAPLLELARKHHRDGCLPEAEGICKRILSLQPNHSEALHLLGVIAYQQGKITIAADLIRQAIGADESNPAAHSNLGLAFLRLGQIGEALACFRKALSLQPDHAEALQNFALALHEKKDVQGVRRWLEQTVGVLVENAGVQQTRALLLNHQGAHRDALVAADAAVRLDPHSAVAHLQRGLALSGLGREGDALSEFALAREFDPRLAIAHYNAAKLLYSMGDFVHARQACDAAIEHDPAMGVAYGLRISAGKVVEGDPFWRKLQAAVADMDGYDPANQSQFHFAMGQAHEQAKNFEASFSHYAHGAAIFRSIRHYDHRATRKMFAALRQIFTADHFSRLLASPGTDSGIPIFILGMPRSGTTLIEQILASHSRIAAGGELDLLDQALHGFVIGDMVCYQGAKAALGCQPVTGKNHVTPRMIAQRYLAGLESFRISPSHEYVTDKMPVNFLRLGFIRAIFPNAKVIHCRRDPLDNCLSIFFTQFAKGYEWGKDLGELGDYYRNYHELMEHWRSILPSGSFYDLDYEAVVADPKGQIRKLLDYVGVSWEEQCLHFHKTQRLVSTASAAQVRKPIYTSSVKRWEPYLAHLGPLVEALGPLADVSPLGTPSEPATIMRVATENNKNTGSPWSVAQLQGETLKLALAHQGAGRLEDAERLYRDLLAADPTHPDALHNLGLLKFNAGHPEQALPFFKKALTARPDIGRFWLSFAEVLLRHGQPDEARLVMNEARKRGLAGEAADVLDARIAPAWAAQPDLAALRELDDAGQYVDVELLVRKQIVRFGQVPALMYMLGLSLLRQGRNDEALPYLESACAGRPTDVCGWNQRALALQRLGRYDEAHEMYLKALALVPGDPEILANTGANLNEAGRFEESLVLLQRGVQSASNCKAVRVNFANTLIGLKRNAEARQWLEALMAEGYRSAQTMKSYGVVLHRMGETVASLDVLRTLVEMEPDFVEALVSFAEVLQDTGAFVEAESVLQQAWEIQRGRPDAWAALAQGRKMTPQDVRWLETAKEIANHGLPPGREFGLRYAMGKFCDDVNDFDQAFANYRRANELKKKFYDSPYDRQNQAGMVDQLISTYTIEVSRRYCPGASDEHLPVFIVGMPRSGTSLVEQIIASHPDTFGAGELQFWSDQMKQYKRQGFLGEYEMSLLAGIAMDYLAELRGYSPTSKRVVDKMPSNYMWLGLIHAVFPNARILHMMRNPIDTCLSIYFQNFRTEHSYANDLDDIAHYYRECSRLMAHWRNVLSPGVFLDVPYESLVEDQEGWSRKIIEFIGLEWDDRRLEFYKTERKIGTASNWQARQPIYKTSKERWRNYEKFVSPLLPLLELYQGPIGKGGQIPFTG